MFGPIIKDLHGNIFSVHKWRLYIAIPKDFDKVIFTKDYLTGITFNLAIIDNTYKAFDTIDGKSIYVGFELKLEGYDESLDIRKSYLYGRKRNKTIP